MKKSVSIAVVAAGSVMAGIGAYGLIKNAHSCDCSCGCADEDVTDDDVEDLDEDVNG